MKFQVKSFALLFSALLLSTAGVFAQPGTEPKVTESGEPQQPAPRDGIYDREIIKERLILPYDHVREADVFWEKRVYRVIDVREKMNKPFAYPKAPFITLLLNAAADGEINCYSPVDTEFKTRLTGDEIKSLGGSVDTIINFDPVTFEEIVQVVTNELNPADVKRFRVKEDWFFDEETSKLEVRILAIAPIIDKYDDNGNFLFEKVMFWAYYPELREVLARERAYNLMGNEAMTQSWEDVFESRFFSSFIVQESNVYDRRIRDYKTGLDQLLEADKIHNEIFNFEHDLWQY